MEILRLVRLNAFGNTLLRPWTNSQFAHAARGTWAFWNSWSPSGYARIENGNNTPISVAVGNNSPSRPWHPDFAQKVAATSLGPPVEPRLQLCVEDSVNLMCGMYDLAMRADKEQHHDADIVCETPRIIVCVTNGGEVFHNRATSRTRRGTD